MRAGELGSRVPSAARSGVKRAALSVAGLWGSRRTLPGFLIIGAQRGGTTSLYNYLIAHPDVAGARLTKEVHFFDTNFARGPDWYRAFFPTRSGLERHHRRSGRRLVVGEASPYYLFHPLAPARAAGLVPDARLIVMLRDPVERAFSHHRHEVQLGYETLSFEEAVRREPERLAGEAERMLEDPTYLSFEHQHHSYVARGFYAPQLQAWRKAYPDGDFCVIGSEEFFADPAGEFHRVQEFLGLRRWDLPAYETWNASSSSRIDPALRSELSERYRPHDRRLFSLLGRSFEWGAAGE